MCMEKQKLKRAALFYEKIIFDLFEFSTQNSLKLKCTHGKAILLPAEGWKLHYSCVHAFWRIFFFWGGVRPCGCTKWEGVCPLRMKMRTKGGGGPKRLIFCGRPN